MNKNIDLIDYVEGRMTPDAAALFEAQMQKDPALKEEVAAQIRLNDHLEYLYAERKVADATKALRLKPKKRRSWWPWISMGLLALMLAGYWRFSQSPGKDTVPIIQPPASQPAPLNEPQNTPANDDLKPIPSNTPANKPMAQGNPTKRDPGAPTYRGGLEPDTDIPADQLAFFEQQFQPVIPFDVSPRWSEVRADIQARKMESALQKLDKLPQKQLENDTAQYLRACVQLMLKQPSSAEKSLYKISNQQSLRNETHRLLVWVYLLQGKDDLAVSTLRLLPNGYTDKETLRAFLDK